MKFQKENNTPIDTTECLPEIFYGIWEQLLSSTYRALHPFLALMYPEINSNLVKSMMERHKQTGLLPTNEYGMRETWCMIGNQAVPVIVDAFLKGDTSFDPEFAYEAIRHAQTFNHNKADWSNYDKYGYFPFDISSVESVSRTLESAYDDYCAALVAKQNEDSAEQRFFEQRADNYKNLFDSSTKLMRGKDSKGNWRSPFDPFLLSHAGTSGGDYTEGNAWQYTWHVQHDIPTLVNLMGGKKKFEDKLDSLFFLDVVSFGGGFHGDVTGMIGQYAHGNEPSHHVAYLYDYTDSPYKTHELIRRIFDRFYLPDKNGLSGNDDCGQMSAWYLFSALGFYPINPLSAEYTMGAPQVKEMTLHLPNGKIFKMRAHAISSTHKYVRSVKLNGKKSSSLSITYHDIMKGGLLKFEMDDSTVSDGK